MSSFLNRFSDLLQSQAHKVLAFSYRSDKILFEIIPKYSRRFPDENFVLACQSAFLLQKCIEGKKDSGKEAAGAEAQIVFLWFDHARSCCCFSLDQPESSEKPQREKHTSFLRQQILTQKPPRAIPSAAFIPF